MPQPRVSVVIPAYNVARYIAEAIDSVLAQTFQDFEIIVVNDGSPDSDALDAVLAPYGARLRCIRKSNGGPASARNAGIAAARSDLIAFLDGDDTWDPGYLSSQLALLDREPSAAAVFPDAVYFGDTALAGKRVSSAAPYERGRVTIESVLKGRSNLCYSCLARREAIEAAGGYDASLRRSEDWDLYLRLLLRGETILVNPQPLLRYRRRDNSLSANEIVMRRAALDVLAKIETLIPPGSHLLPLAANLRRNWRASLERELGRKALAEGRWDQARAHWQEHQKIRPDPRIALALLAGRISPTLLAAFLRRTGRL
jgi:glycosyltransferase involved in cell wall biosynthesis